MKYLEVMLNVMHYFFKIVLFQREIKYLQLYAFAGIFIVIAPNINMRKTSLTHYLSKLSAIVKQINKGCSVALTLARGNNSTSRRRRKINIA